MSQLTKLAEGQECALRLFPYCEWQGTIVPAHIQSEAKGWSIKSPDWWLVHSCMTCHDIIDGRKTDHDLSPLEIQVQINRALFITINRAIDAGLIVIKG